jgi:hypothetical protein
MGFDSGASAVQLLYSDLSQPLPWNLIAVSGLCLYLRMPFDPPQESIGTINIQVSKFDYGNPVQCGMT